VGTSRQRETLLLPFSGQVSRIEDIDGSIGPSNTPEAKLVHDQTVVCQHPMRRGRGAGSMMATSSPKLWHKFDNNRIDYKEFFGEIA
jgi:hypothetical protein